MKIKTLCVILLFAGLLNNNSVYSQIIVEPLFEYPVAPDSEDDLSSRSSWLVTNFWSPMDLSSDRSVDQNALNHAFSVYSAAMQFADRGSVLKSVNTLLGNLKGKPTLMTQFVKAAEESLYGPRAAIWSDEVYLPFLRAYQSEPGISPLRKERYKRQLTLLSNTQPGCKAPSFRYRMRNGHYRDFKAETPYTLLEFGDPDCEDCSFAKLKLEMCTDIMDKVDDKQVRILFIVPDVSPDEESEVLSELQSYPESWTPSIGYGIDDIYDMRQTPSFYLLNSKGEIIVKNLDVTDTIDALRSVLTKEQKSGKKGKNK